MKSYHLLLRHNLLAFLSAYAEIFFIQSPLVGGLLLFIGLININVALSGMVAVATVLLITRFLAMDAEFLKSGFYIYNPLLVGMSVGFIFSISPLSLALIALSSLLTFALSLIVHRLFSYGLLPILSLPFALVSTLIYLASMNYATLYSQALYAPLRLFHLDFLPDALQGYFVSLGTILFLPLAEVGVAIALIMLWHSRLLFVLSVLGYAAGIIIHAQFLGSYTLALASPYAFNYILVAIALGGIFLVPSPRSFLVAFMGVAVSVIIVDASSIFWTLYKIPVFTIPFNIVTLSFLFVLSMVRFDRFAYTIQKTPEQTLDYYLMSQHRFHSDEISIFLPFSGTWSVYQGFDDQWTHQGNWKYAYDFVRINAAGETFESEGVNLNDYYAFNKPVLSPISGYVVDLADHLEDNPIGEVDLHNNWGNYLIIQSPGGLFVEISHFAKNSLKVHKGEFVEAGQILGLCGNSGYSPQPHIHIQVQESGILGAKTLPFHFVSYVQDKTIHYYDNPQRGELLEALFTERTLERILTFMLDHEYDYTVWENGTKIGNMHLKVAMDRLSGKFYFQDDTGNKLFFAKDAGMFYFYDYQGDENAWLTRLYAAIPRIPLISHKEYVWKDYILARFVAPTLMRKFFAWGAAFNSTPFVLEGEWRYMAKDEIHGIFFDARRTKTVIKLDPTHGFSLIKIDDLELRRAA